MGSFAAAVADIPDGAAIAFGGFAGPGTPYNLTKALLDQGAKRLTCIANTTGGAHQPRMPDIGMLVESRAGGEGDLQLHRRDRARPTCCPSPSTTRPARSRPSWCRRARWPNGCAPPAPASPPSTRRPRSAPSSPRAARRAVINGREYLLEYALPCDVAFIRAWRADTAGNLQFRLAQRNFCPLMAMAAKLVIVEVEEDILPAGALDPDNVHLSGIFVQRLVKVPPAPEGLWTVRRQERAK